MVIELRVVQFWSEIILVISNQTRAARSFDFEITRMNIFGKGSDLPFSRKSDREKEKSTVSFTHVQNIICGQTLRPNTVGRHCA